MADWTNQSVDSLLLGEPWTQAKALATFENPVAIAEGADGAPAISQGWHPYDATLNSESDGVLYDHAVGGNVASVETPVLDLNFEYWIAWDGIAGTANNSTLNLQLRRASDADYTFASLDCGAINITSEARPSVGQAKLSTPFVRRFFYIDFATLGGLASTPGIGAPTPQDTAHVGYFAANDRFDRMRLIPSAGNISAGKVWLFRRRFEVA